MANQQFRVQIWTNPAPKAGFAIESISSRLYEFFQGLTKSHRSARKSTPEASNTGNFYSHSMITAFLGRESSLHIVASRDARCFPLMGSIRETSS